MYDAFAVQANAGEVSGYRSASIRCDCETTSEFYPELFLTGSLGGFYEVVGFGQRGLRHAGVIPS